MTMPLANTLPQELLESFLVDSFESVGNFESSLMRLRFDYSEANIKSLSVLAHRMRGTAALYGHPQTSELASLAERVLLVAERLPEPHHEQLFNFLDQVLFAIRSAVERISQGQDEGEIGLEFNSRGGAKLLRELLSASPSTFIRAVRDRNSSMIDDEVLAPVGAVATPASSIAPLVADLRGFFGENPDVWEYFEPEAQEHLEAINSVLEKPSLSHDDISQLFRSTHTLKGSAYMVGLVPFGDVGHSLEDVMSAVRDGQRPLDDQVRVLLQQGTGTLNAMLKTAAGQNVPLFASLSALGHQVETVLGSRAVALDLLAAQGQLAAAAPIPTSTTPASTGSDQVAAEAQAFHKRYRDAWKYYAPEARRQLASLQSWLDGQHELAEPQLASLAPAEATLVTLRQDAERIGFAGFASLIGLMEQLGKTLQSASIPFEATALSALDAGVEAAELMLRVAEGESNPKRALAEAVAQAERQLRALLPAAVAPGANPAQAADPARNTIRVSLQKLNGVMDLVGELVVARARLVRQLDLFDEVGTLLEAAQRRLSRTAADFEAKYLNPLLSNQRLERAAGSEAQQKAGRAASATEMFEELEFDSYNDLNILARSITEMTQDLGEVQSQLSSRLGLLHNEAEGIQKLSRELRSEVGRTRMVPFGQLGARLGRLVKQNTLGKRVRFETSGEEVEVDNLILETIIDPLSHLVRNSLVHGIEGVAERRASGKSSEALVAVRAAQRGNSLVIEVEDDGAGIPLASVRAKALERGFRREDELDGMSDEDILQLIFIPGLSTASEVSDVAGRGVGMDAVATNVRRLGGEIQVQTEQGLGTRFTLKLPLTLIVSDALIVRLGNQRFGLPIGTVRAALQVTPDVILPLDGLDHVLVDGEAVPLVRLDTLFGLGLRAPSDSLTVVVLDAADGRLAVVVDAFIGLEEVVIKGLGEMFSSLDHLSGATIASDGEVILVLDPIGLRRRALGNRDANSPFALSQEAETTQPLPLEAGLQANTTIKGKSGVRRLLLVDDSISVRKVVGKMLERAGYQVVTAVDGQDALEIVVAGGEGHFDAVLTDLEMPRMNGYELIEELRRRAITTHTPIVVMTTRAGEKHRNIALELGANNYFPKPIDEAQLLGYLIELGQRQAGALA
jgi:chemosensory pili system protein ChpA (sensor histidine kinase/response regulator)